MITCGYWEVVYEVEPIVFYFKPWVLLRYAGYITMLCYARRRGLGLSEIHDRCELLIKGST